MKKKGIKIVFLFLLLLCIAVLPIGISKVIKADSGFDADYDYDYGGSSGGYSGGYSSYDDDDDDYHYSYYSSSNHSDGGGGGSVDPRFIPLIVLVVLTPLAVPIIFTIIDDRRSRRRYEQTRNPEVRTQGLKVDHALNREAFDIYYRVQEAWMNQDLEPVRNLLTDEMYNMYVMQLDTLIDNGNRNMMTNIHFISGHVLSRSTRNGIETIKLVFRVTCKDYIVDSANRVVRGNKNMTCDYTYLLTFVRNVNCVAVNCPSCGASLDSSNGNKCPHCGNVVHYSSSTLRMSKKEMLRQSRR